MTRGFIVSAFPGPKGDRRPRRYLRSEALYRAWDDRAHATVYATKAHAERAARGLPRHYRAKAVRQ